MLKKNNTLALCCILLLSGCFVAPKHVGPTISQQALDQERALQYQMFLEQKVDTHNRVQRIGYEVKLAGLEFCQKRGIELGLQVISQHKIDQKYWSAANALYGLANRPKLTSVYRQSPAYKAGLRPLDTIVAADGYALASGEQGGKRLFDYLQSGRDFYQIGVLRNGQRLDYTFKANQVCDYPVVLKYDDAVNAYADGERIIILSGMADFARTDQELALVMAHELAHNTEGHVTAKKTNALGGALVGAIFDGLLGTGTTLTRAGGQIASSSYSVDFEREADYIGMYILARSGYPLEGAGKFWRRMAVKSQGKSIDFASTHPTSTQRMLAIEETANEIENKRQNGFALRP